MDEDETGMNKVEAAVGGVVCGDIVLTNLDVRARELLGPRHVDVRCEHVT
jgi:hypothetical protein